MKKILLAIILLPQIASAQTGLGSLLSAFGGLVNLSIVIVFFLASLYFFWGLAVFVLKVGATEKEEGKRKMLWGIVALFVMVSIWGIVGFISDAFNIEEDTYQISTDSL